MKIKNIMIAAAAITMLLCGCGGNEEAAEQPVTDTSVSEAADSLLSESTMSEKISETADENPELSVQLENTVSDDLFNENKNEYVIALCSDGTYKKLTEEEYYTVYMAEYMSEMLSEEYYNEYVKDYEYSDVSSYEDYKNQLMESFGISEADLTSQEEYSCVFSISGTFDDEKADYDMAAKTAFEYVLKKTENTAFFQNDDVQKNVVIYYYVEGDVMNISAYGYSDNDECEIMSEEFISLSGKDIVNIGGMPVASDTKSLYISAYDELRATVLDNGASEEYDVVIFDYGAEYGYEKIKLDTAELAEKLPGLEKLFISAYIEISDMTAFSRLDGLKELQIDVSGCDDISMLSGLKTDRLVISGISCPADVLAELDVKEMCIECTPSDGVLESIYKLKNVSELTVNRYSDTEPFLAGIENMSGLKKLDLSVDSEYTIDLAPLAGLNNIKDLKIMAHKAKNLEKISEMKSVKKLMLHSMDEEDLSFLSKMTGLEELSLMYVNSSFGPSLQYLKNVKYLSVADITDGADMSRIYQMEDLEQLLIMGERINTRGIDDLKKLKFLNIMLCSYSDLSGLKKCGALEKLMIYNCVTPEFDAKDIEGMTGLKYLDFNCSEIKNYESLKTLTGLEEMNVYFCDLSSGELKEIKKALPDCVITLDDGSTVS
ncbi:MAG: leucine-rich repeat domain-containing protein [Huintestinicola sp.]|uniref:leucine-rich repeat domain-containing protein n=1 Tax=Huintestinicola sp. TaxID=2981661 RepID=UPI003F08D5F3